MAGSVPGLLGSGGSAAQASVCRATRREYEQFVPRIAEDPEAVQIFFRKTPAGVVLPDNTLDEIANHACADLLTMIGIYLENVAPDGGTVSSPPT